MFNEGNEWVLESLCPTTKSGGDFSPPIALTQIRKL